MSQPKFSIIVSIYNMERYLNKCLESLINQSYKNIEIILVDDGSKDRSPIICDIYSNKDSRVQVIHKENGGLSDARNYGIRKANGDYIMFVDSDDYLEADSCEKIYKIIMSYTNLDIIASNIKNIEDEKLTEDMYSKTFGVINGYEFLKIQLRNNTMRMSACRNIYNRQFLIRNHLFFKKGILHEDEEWTPRVFLAAKSVIYLDYSHYIRFLRDGSITRKKDKKQNAIDLISSCKELNELYKEIDDENLKELLLDNNVMLQLNAFYIGRLLNKRYNNLISRKELRLNCVKNKNRWKVKLFCFNKYLYYYLNYITKKLISSSGD